MKERSPCLSVATILAALFLLAVGALLLVSLGNPQWNRWIFVFQKHYLYKSVHRYFFPNMPSKYTGRWCEWDENGNLTYEGFYLNGNSHGTATYFYPNGTKWQSTYDNGDQNGPERNWSTDGTLIAEQNWRDSKMHGTLRGWYENGQLELESNWVDGKQCGWDCYWLEDGRQIGKCLFVDGRPWEGTYVLKYAGGTPERVLSQWHDGKPDGRMIAWYRNKTRGLFRWVDGRWKEGEPWDGVCCEYTERTGRFELDSNAREGRYLYRNGERLRPAIDADIPPEPELPVFNGQQTATAETE